MQLIVTEKPSVARDLARVLGVRPSGRGAFDSPDRVITWCIGHLVELEEPAAYDPRWKAWRLDTLPMLPDRFRLRPVASARDQFATVRGLLRESRFSEVVNACDAGREGELIFRYVYELCGSRLPIRRLWISSLTDEAIRAGFASLRPGSEYEALADAARCRSEADWLVGLNATRAVTVRHRTGGDSPLYSIGRVQTPTLALVVRRDEVINKFVPQDYWELRGTFTTVAGASVPAGTNFEATFRHRRLARLASQALADQLIQRLDAHPAATDPVGPVVERVQQRTVREPPPLLFDLTTLQRTANRRFGLSAARTLEIAQALYETHKLLTYPRTDSRYLSKDVAATLPKLFRSLLPVPTYAAFVRPLLDDADGKSTLTSTSNRRVFDDAKVEDHHAIIPTGGNVADRWNALDRDQQRIYDLVVRRFLGAFHPDAVFAATDLVVRVGAGDRPPEPDADKPADDDTSLMALPPPPDRFYARGRVRLAAGWQDVAGFGADVEKKPGKGAGDEPDSGPSLPAVREGDRLDGKFAAVARQTRPPPRHTEGTLLSAMETAGRAIEDDQLRAAMKDTGLGTPATRAATIETLIKRGFIVRSGKNLEATATGVALIQALPVQSLASPELTGTWEARLARIARAAESRPAFMQDIASYVREVVGSVRAAPANPAMALAAPPTSHRPGSAGEAGRGTGRDPGRAPGRASETRASARPERGRRTRPPAAAREKSPPARGAPAPDTLPADRAQLAQLGCPRCRQGNLLAGKRGWGCSRWREGCAFVVWFEVAGKRLSDAQLRELCEKGKTRKGKWPGGKGAGDGPIDGRLVLDLQAGRDQGAARFERL